MFCISGWLSVPVHPYKWSSTVLQFEVPVPVATRSKAPYTLLVKLSDFTVWRHTWRKNCVNYAVLAGNSAGLRTVLSTRLSHTELRNSPRKSHSFLSLPVDTTIMSQAHLFLAIHSADEHRMIYSSSNTTSLSVVCCQVEVCARSLSRVQKSPTDCGASLFVN